MKIKWTAKASSDALGIFDYITAQSPAYADAVYERLLARPSQLIDHPQSGAIVPEFGREDIRELFVYSFRMIYRVKTDEIRVLTVIHGHRELKPEMILET